VLPSFWLLIVTVPPARGVDAVVGEADGEAVTLGDGLGEELELLAPRPAPLEVGDGDRRPAHPAAAKMRAANATTRATLDPHVQGSRMTRP